MRIYAEWFKTVTYRNIIKIIDSKYHRLRSLESYGLLRHTAGQKIFSLCYLDNSGKAKVSYLNTVVVTNKDVSGSQVSVNVIL